MQTCFNLICLSKMLFLKSEFVTQKLKSTQRVTFSSFFLMQCLTVIDNSYERLRPLVDGKCRGVLTQ